MVYEQHQGQRRDGSGGGGVRRRRTCAGVLAIVVACALFAAVGLFEQRGSGTARAGACPTAAAACIRLAGPPAATAAARRMLAASEMPPPALVYPAAKIPADDGADEEEVPPDSDMLPPGNGPPKAADNETLAWVNYFRANHGAPPLTWDPRLAAGAEYYSGGCPLGHSGAKGLGETMAWGKPDWKSAVRSWYDEGRAMDWKNPGWNPDAGQFTQLIWRDTKAVGCAQSKKACGDQGVLYVCYFMPVGNIIGVDWARHVLPPAQKV